MYNYCAGHGAGVPGYVLYIKFAFVGACLGVAVVSYFFCRDKRDWFWLVVGLSFTLAADYFLILHDRHLPGVAVFCFAHVAYILRAVKLRLAYVLPFFVLAVIGVAYVVLGRDAIFVFALLYAALFVCNIYVSARYLRHNRWLVVTGLLLFAACDICVLLYDLPLYFSAPAYLRQVYPLIWVFYLPSQGLLAVSAVKIRGCLPL